MKRLVTMWLMYTVAMVCLAQKQEFPIPDKLAEFPGGTDALAVFLQENLQYPSSCQMSRVEGRVTVSFIVDKDGNIKNPFVKDSPDTALSTEALRVVKMMPRWKPALLAGKPVKMRFSLPVKFSFPATSLGDIDVDDIANSSIGAKENPRGLYKLQRTVFEDGRKDLITPYSQYKYCTETNTVMITTARSNPLNFAIKITEPREGRLDYTGREYTDGDTTQTRIYDSNQRSFKLRWFQNESHYASYYPWHTYSTEIYDSRTGVEQEVKRIVEMMSMHLAEQSKNPFVGCWHCLGTIGKVDDMDMLVAPSQDTYQIFDEKDACSFYNLGKSTSLQAIAILSPIKYTDDFKGLVEMSRPSKVEWQGKDTFKQTYTDPQGETVTLLWKRSGLPHKVQHLVCTDIPSMEIKTSTPSLIQ